MKRHLLFIVWTVLVVPVAIASRPIFVGLTVNKFAQAANQANVIYLAANPGVFKSEDGGRHWHPLKLPNLISGGLAVVPEDASHLVAFGGGEGGRYFESTDGGKSWKQQSLPIVLPQEKKDGDRSAIFDFVIDAKENGGAWWVVAGGCLWRSENAGVSWEKNSEFEHSFLVPWRRLVLRHTPELTWRLSHNSLFASHDRGKTWILKKQFADQMHGRTFFVNSLIAFPGGRVIVRSEDGWQESIDEGVSWVAATGFGALPDKKHGVPNKSFESTECAVHQANFNLNDLIASCWSPSKSSMLRSPLLYRSQDGANTWHRIHFEGADVWISPVEPNLLLASGYGGGVNRSEDGGESWMPADSGLRFPSPDMSHTGAFALNEPPLIQAVMFRDWTAVEKLVAAGADINAPGNYVSGVLEADMRGINDEGSGSGGKSKSFFMRLRSLGAKLPIKTYSHRNQAVVSWASQADFANVLEDLIRSGYDWGQPAYPGASSSDFRAAIYDDAAGKKMLAGHPIAYWIELYIKTGKFPAALSTAMDLVANGEPELARSVLRRMPADAMLDPGTPPDRFKELLFTLLRPQDEQLFYQAWRRASPGIVNEINVVVLATVLEDKRLSLARVVASDTRASTETKLDMFGQLVVYQQYAWAKRYFLRHSLARLPNAQAKLRKYTGLICEPGRGEWYRTHGIAPEYWRCLTGDDSPANIREKTRMLRYLEKHDWLTADVWEEASAYEGWEWLEKTPEYSRFLKRYNSTQQGIIGIRYEINDAQEIVISELTEEFPAVRAGLRKEDRVVAVGGVKVTPENAKTLARSIRGEPGSKVTIRIKREGAEFQVALKRERQVPGH